MKIIKVWWLILSVLPFYGAANSNHWNGHELVPDEPWIGFIAGLIVSVVLAGITVGINKIFKLIKKKD